MISRYCARCFKLHYLLYSAFILSITVTFYFLVNKFSNSITIGESLSMTHMIPVTQKINVIRMTRNERRKRPRILETGRSNCIPYTVPDPRPFFEREPPQLNLPQRISDTLYENLLRELRSRRLLVLSTARNVEHRVDNFRNHIEPIVDLFHPSSRILVCESDSSDKTVEKLKQWSRAQLYAYGNLSNPYPYHTDRIAFCRNKLLNLAHEITADYFFVVDVDIFATHTSSFLSNFRYNTDDWSVMTASSPSIYYDIWALRTLSDSNMNFDVWHRVWDLTRDNKTYCPDTISGPIINYHQKRIPTDRGLIEVRSAFGGAGLYKANVTYGCQYSGANMTCEHVPFHLCIREKNQARIFINPLFLIF